MTCNSLYLFGLTKTEWAAGRMIISGSFYFVKGTWRKWICELNPEMFGSMWLKASSDFGLWWGLAEGLCD